MILPPREFITKTMAEATTTFDVFDAIVGRMEADAAKIAELELKRGEMRWHKDAARDTLISLENSERHVAERDARIAELEAKLAQYDPKNAYPYEVSE